MATEHNIDRDIDSLLVKEFDVDSIPFSDNTQL